VAVDRYSAFERPIKNKSSVVVDVSRVVLLFVPVANDNLKVVQYSMCGIIAY
jgi:hypothetical protein